MVPPQVWSVDHPVAAKGANLCTTMGAAPNGNLHIRFSATRSRRGINIRHANQQTSGYREKAAAFPRVGHDDRIVNAHRPRVVLDWPKK
jgi:hypothetical protein